MKRQGDKIEPSQFLSGWKEIATYLGKGVRTVQRYEHELRLPVRRASGKSHGSVIATVTELDAWVKALPLQARFPLSQPSHTAVLRRTHDDVAETQKLCEHLVALREETRASFVRLRRAFDSLQERLGHKRQEITPPTMAGLDPDARRRKPN